MRNTTERGSEFRAGILEVLELIADGESQLEYQAKVPCVHVGAELFNQWEDVYLPGDQGFVAQFDARELSALRGFADLVDAIALETPQQLPALEVFMKTRHWQRLAAGAGAALQQLDRTRRSGWEQG